MDYDSDNIFPRSKTGRDAEVRNVSRNGKVVEVVVDKTQVSCRVQYLDKQGLISKPLPVKQFGSRSTQSFWCPKVGDDVHVTVLPNGHEEGFIDGSFYNTGNPPPITDPNTRHITFADKTVMEYREADNTWYINSVGPMTIVTKGPVSITSEGRVDVKSSSDIYAESSTQATIKAPLVTVDTPTCKITGNLIVGGTISVAAGMSGQTMTISGNIQHQGNMNTSGVHTDSKGTHKP